MVGTKCPAFRDSERPGQWWACAGGGDPWHLPILGLEVFVMAGFFYLDVTSRWHCSFGVGGHGGIKVSGHFRPLAQSKIIKK